MNKSEVKKLAKLWLDNFLIDFSMSFKEFGALAFEAGYRKAMEKKQWPSNRF
jgi:hypothetical protein